MPNGFEVERVAFARLQQRLRPMFERLLVDQHAPRTIVGFLVGDNRPYDARILLGWTLERHAVRRDLPYVLFEIRNDGIETARAQRVWAARLYRAMVETRFGLT